MFIFYDGRILLHEPILDGCAVCNVALNKSCVQRKYGKALLKWVNYQWYRHCSIFDLVSLPRKQRCCSVNSTSKFHWFLGSSGGESFKQPWKAELWRITTGTRISQIKGSFCIGLEMQTNLNNPHGHSWSHPDAARFVRVAPYLRPDCVVFRRAILGEQLQVWTGLDCTGLDHCRQGDSGLLGVFHELFLKELSVGSNVEMTILKTLLTLCPNQRTCLHIQIPGMQVLYPSAWYSIELKLAYWHLENQFSNISCQQIDRSLSMEWRRKNGLKAQWLTFKDICI